MSPDDIVGRVKSFAAYKDDWHEPGVGKAFDPDFLDWVASIAKRLLDPSVPPPWPMPDVENSVIFEWFDQSWGDPPGPPHQYATLVIEPDRTAKYEAFESGRDADSAWKQAWDGPLDDAAIGKIKSLLREAFSRR